MDKLSKKIINNMIATEKSTTYIWAFDENAPYECQGTIVQIADTVNTPVEDVRACIRYLHEQGYVEYQTATTFKEKRNVGFHLSHKGLHSLEFQYLECKRFIMHSILTPIVVSAITTLLLNLLGLSL